MKNILFFKIYYYLLDRPNEPDKHDNPNRSNDPYLPDDPDKHDDPNEPNDPDEPDDPYGPDNPDGLDDPDGPDNEKYQPIRTILTKSSIGIFIHNWIQYKRETRAT